MAFMLTVWLKAITLLIEMLIECTWTLIQIEGEIQQALLYTLSWSIQKTNLEHCVCNMVNSKNKSVILCLFKH